MRSYEAARGYFGFLEFCSWCLIVVGAVVGVIAAIALSEMNRGFGGPPAGVALIFAFVPGGGIAFAGLMGLVFAQIGRAGVDSAEYGQQSLKIAREQLEISKQALKQGAASEPGYGALQEAKDALKSDQDAAAVGAASSGYANLGNDSAEAKEAEVAPHEIQKINIGGMTMIEMSDGTYRINDRTFKTIDDAKEYIRLERIKIGGVARR